MSNADLHRRTAWRLATPLLGSLAYRSAFNWTSRERFPFASTVGGDLGERLLAQRFPGGLLTRKGSQVQTLSRPPIRL
jgi:hypothetical protein